MDKTQRIILYSLALIAGLAAMALSVRPENARQQAAETAPQQGFLAPDFTLTNINGKTVTLSELKGQAVMVNLWATWCPPCRAEMPTIEKIYKEYKDQGFTVLAIDMTYQDDPLAIQAFAEELGLTFPILLDETGIAAKAYQLRSMPSSFFIDRDGVVAEVVIGGPMSETLLRTRVEKILQ